MKQIQLFRQKRQYEDYVRSEILVDPELRDHPFYRRLVQFVLDAKAPLFYSMSDETEYRNFSSYYHFILDRRNYADETVRTMYFLHDLTHSLFWYPHDLTGIPQEKFQRIVIRCEYAASNETEVLIHYRVPGLRERVFRGMRLLYDVLVERGVTQPSVDDLFRLRVQLIEETWLHPFFFPAAQDAPVRDTLVSYRGNRGWCKDRFEEVRRLGNPTEWAYPSLEVENYEKVIPSYESTATQADYERTTLKNIRLAFTLLDLAPPQSFDECLDRVGELEGKILVHSITPRETS